MPTVTAIINIFFTAQYTLGLEMIMFMSHRFKGSILCMCDGVCVILQGQQSISGQLAGEAVVYCNVLICP